MQEGLPNSAGSCCVDLQEENNYDTPQQKTSINLTFSGDTNVNSYIFISGLFPDTIHYHVSGETAHFCTSGVMYTRLLIYCNSQLF